MGSPSRFLSGLATVAKEEPLGSYPLPDPFHTGSTLSLGTVSFADDMVGDIDLAGYTIVGASSTFALADGLGGFATLTPGAATTVSAAYRNNAAFQFVAGNKFWYVCRMASSVATGILFYCGLVKSGNTTTDSLFFKKAAAGTTLDLVSTVGSTATTLVSGLTTPVAATYFDAGFYFDGADLLVYINDALAARVVAPTIGSANTFNLTNALLTPIVGLTPLASETLSVDYQLVACELTR